MDIFSTDILHAFSSFSWFSKKITESFCTQKNHYILRSHNVKPEIHFVIAYGALRSWTRTMWKCWRFHQWYLNCPQAEGEVQALTRRIRLLEEDFDQTETRLQEASSKLEEASKAADESERSVSLFSFITDK